LQGFEGSVEIENMRIEEEDSSATDRARDMQERLRQLKAKQPLLTAERVELEREVKAGREALEVLEREMWAQRRASGEMKAELKATLEDLEGRNWEENKSESSYQSSFADLHSVHQAHVARLQSSIAALQQQLLALQVHASDLSRELLQLRLSHPSPQSPAPPSLWVAGCGLVTGLLASSLLLPYNH